MPPISNIPRNMKSDNNNEQSLTRSNKRPSLHSSWSGFYKKTVKERQAQLRKAYPELFRINSSADLAAMALPPMKQLPSSEATDVDSEALIISSDIQTKLTRQEMIEGTIKVKSSVSPTTLDVSLRALSSLEDIEPFPIHGLDEHIADNMIENCIGTMGLPVGVALNFLINDEPTIIPMAIEEPSVIAAVSGAAKTISSFKGFTAVAPERNIVISQIQLLDIADDAIVSAIESISEHKQTILDLANAHCANMVARGGGALDVTIRRLQRKNRPQTPPKFAPAVECNEWLIVHIHIDVCDAMGANCASSVAEGVAPFLAEITKSRVGLRIVSNLNVDRLAKASFRIPIPMLAYKSFSGDTVASRILEAYEWAELDPYRTTTHNKGIMNGVDAVAIATGQDWRAIEAACHAWASGAGRSHSGEDNGGYRSLTRYWIEEDDTLKAESNNSYDNLVFCGELELPLMVGTKGGAVNTNPVYGYTLGLMGSPDSKSLAMAMACVGLAQNFAALRALATEGIQRGHMALHARNIAIAAGAPQNVVAEVTSYMIERDCISFAAAREYMDKHKILATLRRRSILGAESEVSEDSTNSPNAMLYEEVECDIECVTH